MKTKSIKSLRNLDAKDRSFIKSFGQLHPINDIDESKNRRVHIVKDDEDDDYEFSTPDSDREANRTSSKAHRGRKSGAKSREEIGDLLSETIDDVVMPYQQLLSELSADHSKCLFDSKRKSDRAHKTAKLMKKKTRKEKFRLELELSDADDDLNASHRSQDDAQQANSSQSESETEDAVQKIGTHDQEVLCKDALDNEETLRHDPFTVHFENSVENDLIEILKRNLNDKARLNERAEHFQFTLPNLLKWPQLGNLIYTPILDEKKQNLQPNKNLKQLFIKQRILDRINESIGANLSDESPSKQGEYFLEPKYVQLLNMLSHYVDYYDPNVDIESDAKTKFTYAIHILNHALKTRSRIIAHNDKLKQQNKSSNLDVEYRDQGLTRPKILVLVPYRKCALKLVKMFISLLMRKNEEFVSNKKRFFDSFGPNDDDDDEERDEESSESGGERRDDSQNATAKEEHGEKAEDFRFLNMGNTDDHFKLGISVSKKSLKLFTEFYASDIIIASPLGLKTIIGAETGADHDHDFLSSIELLIVDNADVLMMQNWEHVLSVFDNLHLQPKKNHDVDFSRVRYWLLEGHARFYRQTLVFSRIPAPCINSIFNRHCANYAGKCQIDVLKSAKYQLGTICQIGFQLGQMFHRVECDSPLDLADARFNFFVEKILPKFRDEMMSHTLIFVPSYFDFVKLRNYFKKSDLSSMCISEYTDKKGVDRSRYLFFHGKVHFMLLTERFYFYKRYKIRGINHLIFYELPHYAEYYPNFCNFLPDPKRKNLMMDNFSSTILYSKFDAQKLCAIVGQERAQHMLNSEKNVHMFMTE